MVGRGAQSAAVTVAARRGSRASPASARTTHVVAACRTRTRTLALALALARLCQAGDPCNAVLQTLATRPAAAFALATAVPASNVVK